MRIQRHLWIVHVLLVFLAALPAATHAASALPVFTMHGNADIDGRWEGHITLPGMKLGIEVTLSRPRAEGAGWTGTITIPLQQAKDLPLDHFDISGTSAKFSIKDVPGNPTFIGEISGDGASISGDFEQGGGRFKFEIKRAGEAAKASADALSDFASWIDAAAEAWMVPGIAVAVVRGDDIIFTHTYGHRDIDKKLPVTPGTLFAIGSSTKAFTTAVMASLADEGLIDWEKPVRTFMPEFALQNEDAAAGMTPLDLVTHRSGMPRHDLMWYNSPFSRDEILRRLRYLPLNKEPRTTFQYNNLMYLAAGCLSEKVAGKSWEELVRERLFEPLGMKRSNFSVAESEKDADFAVPYEERDDVLRKMKFRDITTIGPAGSINSTVLEMARWASLHLSDGTREGRRILSKSALDLLHTPAMQMGGVPDPTEDGGVNIGYAPGWFAEVYRGHVLLSHGGNIDGFSALVGFMPRDTYGFVILCNKNGAALPGLVMRHAADRLLGLERRDWNGEALSKRALSKGMLKESESKKAMFRVEGTSPSHALAEYAGEYEHPGYGVATVSKSGEGLSFTINGISAPLEHWHYDIFNCGLNERDRTLENSKLRFGMNLAGDISEVRISIEPAVDDIVFVRRPSAELSDPALLARFEGEYQLGPQTVRIVTRRGVLFANVPGQPEYELTPQVGRAYALKGMSGFNVRFTLPQDGPATEAIFIQPNGVFVAKRK